MPIKIFTTISGKCPFGKGCEIDSLPCRRCEWFYRTGTAMFFWCSHPAPEKPQSIPTTPERVPETKKTGMEPKKRGRPPGKAQKRPVNGRKKKNG